MTVLAIQNDPTDPPLLIGDWLDEAGVPYTVLRADEGHPVPRSVPDGVTGVIALGGEMGAHDDDVAPWLADERALLVDAVDRGIPVLGVCLGGQLLAAATGGRVTLGPVTEIGCVRVHLTDAGASDPVTASLLVGDDGRAPAAQWHQDNIVELPPGADLLVTGDACRVQGFRIGGTAYGLQLHPELDADTFAQWAAMSGDAALRRSGVDPDAVTAEVVAQEHEMARAWRPVALAWAALVRDRAQA